MKLTRKQLRRLIAEAIDEGRNIIVDPEGEAFVASDAYSTGAAKDAQTTHPKLATLRQSGLAGQRQARQLAVDLDMQPDLTSAEATAVEMGKQKAMMPDTGLEYPIDKEALYIAMKRKSKRVLELFGFQYIEDLPHLDPVTGEAGYDDVHEMLRFQARALGCGVYDLAFAIDDTEESRKAYNAILDLMSEMDMSKKSYVPIPEDKGRFGSNEMYDLDGLRVLFTRHHMGGYHTATICGK